MKKISKLLCTCFILSVISNIFVSMPVSAADNKKMVFLYTGKYNKTKDYSPYSTTSLSKLTNVNEFVINTGSYDAYGDGGDSCYGDLANSVVNCINNVLSIKSNAKFWICIPQVASAPYNGSAFDYADYYTPLFKTYMQKVKNLISSSVWNNNIVGFYFSTEQIYFDISNPNNAIGTNTQVELMNNISTYARTSADMNNSGAVKKKFLWAPFIGNINTTEYYATKVATVTNKTNIFDYVLLQPGYYFKPANTNNLETVYSSVINQCLVKSNGSYLVYHNVTLSKASGVNTQFGVQMEIDYKYMQSIYPDSDYKFRYDNAGNPFASDTANYVNIFNPIKNKYPFSFYCGDEVTNCGNKINEFFSNGIKGDLNNSGSINSTDLLLLKNYLLGTTTNINLENADMNNDGKVNSTDNLLLKKIILNDFI